MRRPGEEEPHAGERVGARLGAERREERPHAPAEGVPEHRPDEEGGREDAADRPRPDGEGGDDEAEGEERQDVLGAPGAAEERADRLASVPHDLRVAQRDEAEHEAGGGHGHRARQGQRAKRLALARRAKRKAAATAPPRTPSAAKRPISQGPESARAGTWNTGSCPNAAQVRSVATADETASGANTSREKLPKMISIVKRAAPIGVL